jgi:hypothetical protein
MFPSHVARRFSSVGVASLIAPRLHAPARMPGAVNRLLLTMHMNERRLHATALSSAGDLSGAPLVATLKNESISLAASAAGGIDASLLNGDKDALPAKIAALVETIASLNLIEAMLLSNGLKKKLGLSDMPAGMSMGFAAAPAGGAAALAAPSAATVSPVAAAAAAPPKEEVKALVSTSSLRCEMEGSGFLIL